MTNELPCGKLPMESCEEECCLETGRSSPPTTRSEEYTMRRALDEFMRHEKAAAASLPVLDHAYDLAALALQRASFAVERREHVAPSAAEAPSRNEIIEECARVCDRAAGECENLLHEQPWSDYVRACRNEAQSLAIGIRALKK